MNPGELNERVQILTLKTEAGIMRWEVFKNIWAKVEITGKTNYFSKVGMGVLSVKFTMRRQSLSLYDAICFRGRHYFITGITPISNLHMEVETAKIEPVPCVQFSNETTLDQLNRPVDEQKPALTFPGMLVEKYLRSNTETGHDEGEITLVLVTPKQVQVDAGKLIEVQGKPYKVTACHMLDEYKNEYEIIRTEDH